MIENVNAYWEGPVGTSLLATLKVSTYTSPGNPDGVPESAQFNFTTGPIAASFPIVAASWPVRIYHEGGYRSSLLNTSDLFV